MPHYFITARKTLSPQFENFFGNIISRRKQKDDGRVHKLRKANQ